MRRGARMRFAATADMAKSGERRKPGRRAEGPGGQRVSDYPQVMIRLPHETKATLDALSGVSGMPVWRLIDQAIAAYVKQLPRAEQKLVGSLRTHRARNAAES